MKMIVKFIKGLNAALNGMMSVAGFAILAFALPLLMLKIKGNEGREIAHSKPKLRASEASISQAPIFPEVVLREVEPRVIEQDPNSFSFGNSIEQDRRPVLNLSIDPNALR